MRRLDLVGWKFGRLVVQSFSHINKYSYWNCICDCGNEIVARGSHIVDGNISSCGCYQRQRMSEVHKGKTFKHSEQTKQKLRKPKPIEFVGKISGSNNHNWNPNKTTEQRIKERHLPEIYEWKYLVKERDGFTCQQCGDSTGGNLRAHHLYGYDNFALLRTEVSNGITFCDKCHKKFHHIYGYGNNTKEQVDEFMEDSHAI